MPGNHSVCKVHAVLFLFLETKEAVDVIEASDIILSVEVNEATEVFRTTQSLKINDINARITNFDVLKKKIFWINSWNFSEILHSLRTEAVEDRDVTFNQIKGS